MPRLRLDIAYDGTDFRGWAAQPGLRTVQGAIEDALERLVRTPVRTVVAGRTDAGVHASGQVAHVDIDEGALVRLMRTRKPSIDPAAPPDDDTGGLARRLRGLLDDDVVVVSARRAPEGFDARFSAVWRRYRYRIADAATAADPMSRRSTTPIPARLDVARMDAAARSLRGLWDFAAYCKPRPEATTIRTLFDFSWSRDKTGTVIADIRADAFCHSMVRALVGACVAVGRGRLHPDDVVRIRDELERTSAFAVLPARGLTLVEVGYPADDLLAERAAVTRNRRS